MSVGRSRRSRRSRRAPDYGLDAPPVVLGFAGLGLVGIVLVVVAGLVSQPVLLGWGVWDTVVGFAIAGLMVHSSRVGKIRVRDRLLDGLHLRGDEDVLDLGCGSGLVLVGAAQRLSTGTATGVDLWRFRDQAGATREQCVDNARKVGVAERITLADGDMVALPFPDASFDLVCACLAIHNLHPRARREAAIREAIRVLRPGGRLALIDIAGTRSCATTARAAGLQGVERSGHVRGIFPPARTLTATVPAPSAG